MSRIRPCLAFPSAARSSVLQSSTKLLRWKMFVELVLGLDEGHEDTPSDSVVFAFCSSTAPRLVFRR